RFVWHLHSHPRYLSLPSRVPARCYAPETGPSHTAAVSAPDHALPEEDPAWTNTWSSAQRKAHFPSFRNPDWKDQSHPGSGRTLPHAVIQFRHFRYHGT